MKRIGIITLYGNKNFGNKLQNYAVQKCFERRGCICSTIISKEKKISVLIKMLLKNIINSMKFLINPIKKYKSFRKDRCRYNNFNEFNKKYIKYTKFITDVYKVNKNLNDKFDFFSVGSDQVWNYTYGLVPSIMLLEFSDPRKNISFSASFGVSDIPEELKEIYTRSLLNIFNISVRESRGAEIVKELTGKSATLLLDPTMLLTKSQWQDIAKKPKILDVEDKYILNYFLGELSKKRKTQIELLAKKNGCKIINILDKNDPFYVSGPSEFVYLEEHAELICTDSFHSCVFGILMDTPFVVFDREDENVSMNSRIDTLLAKFKLEDRKYNGSLDESRFVCNYSHCDEILNVERKKADDFLKKALSIDEEK